MYLFQRLFGVCTYALVLLFMYCMVGYTKNSYHKTWLWLYLIALSVMGFFFVPPSGSDLYRLQPIMHIYANCNLKELWKVIVSSNTPGSVLYYYLIGQLSDGFLSGITVFIVFLCCFSALQNAEKSYPVTSTAMATVLLLFMSRGLLGEVIDGIRTMLAFSIIAFCCYKEFIDNRSFIKDLPLYIIAASLHAAAIVLVLFRVLYLTIQANGTLWRKIVRIVLMFGLLAVCIHWQGNRIMAAFEKGKNYFLSVSYSYFWETILGLINICVLFYLIRISRKLADKATDMNMLELCRFLLILSILCVITLFFDYNTFHRLELFLNMLMSPVAIFCFHQVNNMPQANLHLRRNLFLVSFLMLLLSCSRGNLCSLKFWN